MTARADEEDTTERVNGVAFDRKYWAQDSTQIFELMIAEGLLRQEHSMMLKENYDTVVAWLWEIGGDTMAIEGSLIEMVGEVEHDIVVAGDEQCEEVVEAIGNLERLRDRLDEILALLQRRVEKWQQHREETFGGGRTADEYLQGTDAGVEG
jgi:hypothetical protein